MVFKSYFKVQIFCFKMMGILMEDVDWNRLTSNAYAIYSFLLLNFFIYLFLITEAIDLILKWGDLDNMTFNLCYLVTHFAGLCKMAVIMHQKSKIRTFYQSLESGYFLPNYERGGSEEFRIIANAIWQSNMQTYVFYTFVTVIVANRGFYAGFDKGYFITLTSANGNETIDKHYKLMPYTTWIPFDTNVNPYYEIGFAYQIVSALIYGLLIGTCDSFIAGFMVHIKAQLLILKNSCRSYIHVAKVKTQVNHDFQKSTFSKRYLDNGLKSNEDVKKLNPETLIYAKRYFRDCIIHHQQIIKLVEIVESEFNYLMLIQFLGSLLLLCLSLFQLSINDIRSTRFFSMLCFACLMLFQLLIFCWNGNEVLVESLEIAFAAYDSDWFVCDIATQKAVVLVIQRAQRALQLSAGKFAYLTLETYMSILRASGSYYMVLRKVNE